MDYFRSKYLEPDIIIRVLALASVFLMNLSYNKQILIATWSDLLGKWSANKLKSPDNQVVKVNFHVYVKNRNSLWEREINQGIVKFLFCYIGSYHTLTYSKSQRALAQ